MSGTADSVGSSLESLGQHHQLLNVRLSRELITLLSEQLYQSPAKAIEELVVNSFDADASNCYIMVPVVSAGTDVGRLPVIAVYDDGVGMDSAGLADLWHIGSSTKREEQIIALRKRRQIGKFGIGKLATYALANRITYLTSSGQNEILGLSLSFDEFKSDPVGPESPVQLEVRSLSRDQALDVPLVTETIRACGLEPEVALNPENSWTLALLEELKPRANALQPGRLRWVLRTAMPLSTEFDVTLNGDQVLSSKIDIPVVVTFTVADLPKARIDALSQRTGQDWHIEARPAPPHLGEHAPAENALVCDLFDEGIFGKVIVTQKSLYGGKSEDLTRSHGFFVRVRGRLVNEEDALFGLNPQVYEVFNRFRADIDADDLDDVLTAPREGVGLSERRTIMTNVLLEIFREARARYDKWISEQSKPQDNKREPDRNYVDPRNVERPVADALLGEHQPGPGSDVDEDWFYLDVPAPDEINDVVSTLYEYGDREPYSYELESLGRTSRLVRFVPGERKFVINDDHDLVIAFQDDARAMDLLYDFATAESLLEVYLRESGLSPHLVGAVLERRDTLLRSLAREQVTSVHAIAANLRDSVSSERDLEISLVVAARALGFVAKHMSGSTNPDGLARLRDYPQGERKITLEAKSSGKVPSLGAIDFAGLAQHVTDQSAQGCLLIAPDYPGGSRGDNSAAAKRATELRISCWTVEQLARVIEATESRYITARRILEIIFSAFKPEDVARSVDALLSEPVHTPRDLAQGIIQALKGLEVYGPPDLVRSIDMIMPDLGRIGLSVPVSDVRNALHALAAASQGAMTMTTNDRFNLNTSVEELERRVSSITGGPASARRASTFRAEDNRPEST